MLKPIVAMLAIIAVTGNAFAKLRTINPDSKLMIGTHGYIGENIAGTVDLGLSYGCGMKIGYGISEKSILYTGFALLHKDFLRSWEVGTESHIVTYSQNYMDFVLAHRYLYRLFYFDAGLYYGNRIGRMKYKGDGDDGISGKVPDTYTHNDCGLLAGFGVLLPIGTRYAAELGSEFKLGLVNVYTEKEKVRNMTLGVSAGMVMFF